MLPWFYLTVHVCYLKESNHILEETSRTFIGLEMLNKIKLTMAHTRFRQSIKVTRHAISKVFLNGNANQSIDINLEVH